MNQPGMRVFPRIEGAPARVRERLAAIPTAIPPDGSSLTHGAPLHCSRTDRLPSGQAPSS